MFVSTPPLPGKALVGLNKFSFRYFCGVLRDDPPGDPPSETGTCVMNGGSVGIFVPIDEDGDGVSDGLASINALTCGAHDFGASSGSMGLVNLSCPVFYDGFLYSNWDAFAAANPRFRIARNAVVFIRAESPFDGTVYDIQIGQRSS